MNLHGIPVAIGLLLAAAVMGTTLAVTFALHPEEFPSIHYACAINGLAPTDCLARARDVGIRSLVAFAVVVGLGIWRGWFFSPEAGGATNDDATPPSVPVAQSFFIAATLALVSGHTATLIFGPAYVSRLNESETHADFISLENLLLPLLAQLFVSTPDKSASKLPLLAALLIAMSLSPYRAMLFAIFLFAMLVPLALSIWRWCRDRQSDAAVGRKAAVAAVIGVCLAIAGAQDTKSRSPVMEAQSMGLAALPPQHEMPTEAQADIAPQFAAQADAPPNATDTLSSSLPKDMLMPPTDLTHRLAQRLVFPLFQAAIAGQMAESGAPLPSLADQVLRKLRLGDSPNLEEYLFRHIYGSTGHGETTSLTYGEAHVYFPGPPLVWMGLVPLSLILSWRFLSRRGMECGTLFGFALWRSSFSGLIPILPALFLQTLGLWLLRVVRLERFARLGHVLLMLALLLALAIEGGNLAGLLTGRRDVLYSRFELAQTCWMVSPSMVSLAIDQVGERHGLPMRSVLVANHRSALVIALPYGRTAETLLGDIRHAIALHARCPNGPAQAETVMVQNRTVVGHAVNPLQALIVLVLVAALVTVWVRPATGDRR